MLEIQKKCAVVTRTNHFENGVATIVQKSSHHFSKTFLEVSVTTMNLKEY